MMLVASGPAFGASPSMPCRPFRRSIRVQPCGRFPNRQIVIRQTAPASGPVRRVVRLRRAFPFPPGGSEAGSQSGKPAFSNRRTDPNSLACLPLSSVFPLCRSRASLRLPKGLREPANGFAPLAASAVRGADPKIYHACFPILLRASPPYRSVSKFPFSPRGLFLFEEAVSNPLDDLRLRLSPESRKRNLWMFSTV